VWHAQVKAHAMVDTFSQILQCGWVMPSTVYGIRLKTMNASRSVLKNMLLRR